MAVGYTKYDDKGHEVVEDIDIDTTGFDVIQEPGNNRVESKEPARNEEIEKNPNGEEPAKNEEIEKNPNGEEPAKNEEIKKDVGVKDGHPEELTDEVGQVHGAFMIEPQPDGQIKTIPFGVEMNKAPESISKEFTIIKDNIIDKEMLASRLPEVTDMEIDDVMLSVEKLKEVLDNLGIPYDKNKNLIIEDRIGSGKTAFCLRDEQRENEEEQQVDMEQDMDVQSIPESQGEKKIDERIRDVSGIGSGEIHAVINANDKKEFNNVIDRINADKERVDVTREHIQQEEKRTEKETREQGGMDIGNR